MMLIIGALSLLSVLTLNVNTTFLMALSTSLEAQAQLNAFSIGQNLMDEVLAKAFDENTVDGKQMFDETGFTTPSKLGPDAGETVAKIDTLSSSLTVYDDVDDYHLYTRVVRDSIMDYYTVTCRVSYVADHALDSEVLSRTFLKGVTVTVSHPNLPQDKSGNIIPVVIKEIVVSRRYF